MPARPGVRMGGGWPATPTVGQLASAQGSQGQRRSVRGSEALCAQQATPRRLEKSSGAREETGGPRGSGERGGHAPGQEQARPSGRRLARHGEESMIAFCCILPHGHRVQLTCP